MVYPMFALVILTFAVLGVLLRARVAAVRRGQLSLGYFRLYQGADEPDATRKPSRHLSNLFETPVLFYVVCLAALATHVDGRAMRALAWTYVALRCIHAFVHIRGNNVIQRMWAYLASLVVLLAMWICLVAALGVAA